MKLKIFCRVLSAILSIFAIFLLVGLTCVSAHSQTTGGKRKVYEFTGGNWYDGGNFKSRTFYSVGGILTEKKPKRVDEKIDLENNFVIPPFADAHTHNLDGTFNLDNIIKQYLDEGTFYVQVLANHASQAKLAMQFLNRPTSVDAIYANGALTSTYGHPFMVYEPLAMGIYSPSEAYKRIEEVKKSRIAENDAYWFFDTKADVDQKWEAYLSSKPAIVKIMLLDATNYQKYVGSGVVNQGLSPEIAEYIVRKAHQAGLHVFAHIETPDDFRLGLRIGVDNFAHAPGYSWNGTVETTPQNELSEKEWRAVAAKHITVIPTAQLGKGYAVEYAKDTGKEILHPDRFERIVRRQKLLFNMMLRNGVRIAVGSDYFGNTLSSELWYLHDNHIFDNRTLLRIAVEESPHLIFPNRKIGRLREGYEASFLVLTENPIKDFAAVRNIRLKVKQGCLLN